MVYGAEAVLPCDIIHDSPRVHMYEEKEVELDWQDNLDALEEERDVAKARSAFYQQQARRYQSTSGWCDLMASRRYGTCKVHPESAHMRKPAASWTCRPSGAWAGAATLSLFLSA